MRLGQRAATKSHQAPVPAKVAGCARHSMASEVVGRRYADHGYTRERAGHEARFDRGRRANGDVIAIAAKIDMAVREMNMHSEVWVARSEGADELVEARTHDGRHRNP